MNRKGNVSTRAYIKQPRLPLRLADLEVPMFAVHGTQETRPGWPAEQLADLMPHARFELIEAAGHYLWLTHPEQLRALLREFGAAQP